MNGGRTYLDLVFVRPGRVGVADDGRLDGRTHLDDVIEDVFCGRGF